ncbi:hypothetical protein [Falsiroseomonas stagni]|nr:hypothetical protein [Falsiroseomonas stagni]
MPAWDGDWLESTSARSTLPNIGVQVTFTDGLAGRYLFNGRELATATQSSSDSEAAILLPGVRGRAVLTQTGPNTAAYTYTEASGANIQADVTRQ